MHNMSQTWSIAESICVEVEVEVRYGHTRTSRSRPTQILRHHNHMRTHAQHDRDHVHDPIIFQSPTNFLPHSLMWIPQVVRLISMWIVRDLSPT